MTTMIERDLCDCLRERNRAEKMAAELLFALRALMPAVQASMMTNGVRGSIKTRYDTAAGVIARAEKHYGPR